MKAKEKIRRIESRFHRGELNQAFNLTPIKLPNEPIYHWEEPAAHEPLMDFFETFRRLNEPISALQTAAPTASQGSYIKTKSMANFD